MGPQKDGPPQGDDLLRVVPRPPDPRARLRLHVCHHRREHPENPGESAETREGPRGVQRLRDVHRMATEVGVRGETEVLGGRAELIARDNLGEPPARDLPAWILVGSLLKGPSDIEGKARVCPAPRHGLEVGIP